MRSSSLKALCMALLLTVWGASQAQAGSIVRLIYDGITGTAISNLTQNAIFPASPTAQEVLTEYFEGVVSTGTPDNYGSWIRGYIEAPQTGNYVFWVASDDSSQLWLSTDATQAHTNLIASVADGQYSDSRQYTKFASQKSANISLTKGQKYYVEVFHKEGAGGDSISVGWTLPDGTLERPIPGYRLEPYNPAGTALAITQQPATVAVTEAEKVVFYVNVDAATPPTFQWYRNSTQMAGETLSALVMNQAKLADNNVTYYVMINGSLKSDTVTLSVSADTTAPAIVSANALGYDTYVQVIFSKPVTPATANTAGNYTIDNGITVNSAVLQSGGIMVVLRTSKMDLTKVLTLTVNGIKDFATAPNTLVNGTAQFGTAPGSIALKVFLNITGTAVTDLTGNANFPNNPSYVYYTNIFEGFSGFGDNYATYILGFLAPDTTGNYSIAVASDDASEVWLSTDENPANKVLVASLTGGYSNARNYQTVGGGVRTYTDSIHLNAGQKYYVEALQKEGGGGDNISVAWQLGGGAIADATVPISGNNLIPWIDPTVPLAISTQPASQTIVQSRDATFTVAVTGFPAFTGVQWYRGGVAIADATGLSYTLVTATTNDNGSVFSVVVSNLVYTVTSSNAVLSINMDNVPPTLAGAGSMDGSAVSVVFNELIDPTTAGNKANYAVTGVTITSATVNADGKSVSLVLSGPVAASYQVTVSNVKDLAGNAIVASSKVTGGILGLTVVNASTTAQPFSVTYAGDITIVAGGDDIWNAADAFVYAYTTEAGDFDYKLDVKSLTAANVWTKCGIDVRVSTAVGSQHVFAPVTPQAGNNFYASSYRPIADAASFDGSTAHPAATFPNSWIRVQRVGNVFTLYISPDGVTWTLHDTRNTDDAGTWTAGPMPPTVLVGIATTSHDTANTTTAVVSDFGTMPQTITAITTDLPATLTRSLNAPFSFTIGASGYPIKCQWQKDGVDIAGAVWPKLTLPAPLAFTDAGIYTVKVYNSLGTNTSKSMVLTVVQDVTPPTIVAAAGSASYDSVIVSFSEWVDPSVAADPNNYTISGGVTVTGATLQANQTNVLLNTSAQVPGTVYTLTVNNVQDLSALKIVANSTKTFTAFKFITGFMTFQIWDGITTGTAADLQTNTRLAGPPDRTMTVNESQTSNAEHGDNYGGLLSGYIVPSQSGNYRFYIAGDDTFELYLSTDENPANKVMIANLAANWTAYQGWQSNITQTSALIPLVSGTKYYLAAYQKEGGGGDFVNVAWSTPSSPNTTNIISGANIGVNINVDLSSITISQQPTNVTVIQGRTGTFSVVATGTSAVGTNLTYQWQKTGVDIANATSSSYTTPPMALADNNTQFSCVVSIPGKSLASTAATLTVIPDVTLPTLTSAFGMVSNRTVTVNFSEKVDPATAANTANYTVNGTAPTSAVLSPSGTSVVLTMPALTGATANVLVSNVRDLAGNPIASASASAPLNSSLTAIDIGTLNNPLEPGLTSAVGASDFDVRASGTDIWDNTDGFHFVYEEKTGDFDVVVRVQRLDPTSPWAKAGLMARENLTAGSRDLNIIVDPAAVLTAAGGNGVNQYEANYRPVADTNSMTWANGGVRANAGAPYPNTWMRLKRAGDEFRGYRSYDGSNWIQIAQMSVIASATNTAYPSKIYVGMATTSHNNTAGNSTVAEYRGYGNYVKPALPEVLFAIANATPNAADLAVISHLATKGYLVSAIPAISALTADATGKALVIISSTITSADAAAKFRDVAVPVLVWENGIYDDMGMTDLPATAHASTGGLTNVTIVNASHPMAAGLAAGNVIVTTIAETFTWGIPNSNAVIIANLPLGQAAIFGYEAGAVLYTNTAPARRVGFFLGDATFVSLTGDGVKLFDAAVAWAATVGVIVQQPTLTISQSANKVTLAWPLAGSTLQSTPKIPATTWTDVAGSATTNRVEAPIGTANEFFRLK